MDESDLVASLRQQMASALAKWSAGKEREAALRAQLRAVTDSELHPAYEHAYGFCQALRALGADTSDFDAAFKRAQNRDQDEYRKSGITEQWWTWRRMNEFIERNSQNLRAEYLVDG